MRCRYCFACSLRRQPTLAILCFAAGIKRPISNEAIILNIHTVPACGRVLIKKNTKQTFLIPVLIFHQIGTFLLFRPKLFPVRFSGRLCQLSTGAWRMNRNDGVAHQKPN
jgi:hypothetical protein